MASVKKTKATATSSGLPESEEQKYRQKCKDLKRRIQEIEDNNDVLTVKIARAKRAVQRMRLERAFLMEKLEERTLLRPDDSDASASPPGPPDGKQARATRDKEQHSNGTGLAPESGLFHSSPGKGKDCGQERRDTVDRGKDHRWSYKDEQMY